LAKKELVILASKLSRLNKWASEHHNAILGSIVGGVGVYKLGKFITDADK
jgi:membrane protein YqaA with SNARE-associated domain